MWLALRALASWGRWGMLPADCCRRLQRPPPSPASWPPLQRTAAASRSCTRHTSLSRRPWPATCCAAASSRAWWCGTARCPRQAGAPTPARPLHRRLHLAASLPFTVLPPIPPCSVMRWRARAPRWRPALQSWLSAATLSMACWQTRRQRRQSCLGRAGCWAASARARGE